jgi:hypothetical protein
MIIKIAFIGARMGAMPSLPIASATVDVSGASEDLAPLGVDSGDSVSPSSQGRRGTGREFVQVTQIRLG